MQPVISGVSLQASVLMWAAAASYAAGCRGTSPITICVQPCWGCGGRCSWGSASLPLLGSCTSRWQVSQLRAGSLWWCVQSSSCLMRVSSSLGSNKGTKSMKTLSRSLCSGGAFTSSKSNIKAVGWGFFRAIKTRAGPCWLRCSSLPALWLVGRLH